MSAFENFLNQANVEAAGVMGEPIEINGKTVLAVFDEQTNDWQMDAYAEESDPKTTLVIPTDKLDKIPQKKQRFKRVAGNETFFITDVKISTGNVELTATNETKRDG